MDALVFDPKTAAIMLMKKKIPEICREDQVVIRVAYSGLCGTDIHIIKGEFPCCDKPFTPGHEFGGIVYKIGSQVTHVKVGDKVAIDPQYWCTTCKFCTTGRYHLCELGGVSMATGIKFDGGWAEYAVVLSRQVYKIPKCISLKQAVLCEPVSCIVHGMHRASLQPPGFQSILIVGAGIIGNLWTAILHYLGHIDVTVVETQRARIDLNRKLDTGFTNYTPEELKNAVQNQGKLWDLAIDCSGNGRAIEETFNAVRDGGTFCIFGVAPPTTKISISPFEIYKKELTITGSNINLFSFPPAVQLISGMGDRYLDYGRLGISEFYLKDFAKAMSILDSGLTAKVVYAINTELEKE